MSFSQFDSLRSLTHDLLNDLTGLQTPRHSTVKHSSSTVAARTSHLSATAEEIVQRNRHVETVIYAEVYSTEDQTSLPFPRSPSPTFSASSSSSTDSDQSSVGSSSWMLGPSYPSKFSASSRPNLRRKKSPQEVTLRQLRMKQSEADLQKMYEKQTMSYLDGTIPGSPTSPTLPQFRMLLTIPE
jgi:hypothetical protein